MAFKYYYEYLNPEGAPEMPEDKRGDEQISEINRDERAGRAGFTNLAILTVTLVFCALAVFVLRANDYSRLDDSKKLTAESFKSGEYFGSLEGDVIEHLALSEKIVRTDNFLSYFCGVGNEFMKSEEKPSDSVITVGGAFRQQSGAINVMPEEITEHEVVMRSTETEKEPEETKTKKTKKTTKKTEETTTTSGTTAAMEMTTRETFSTSWTTTTTREASTTTAVTNNDAPDVTTKQTTESTTTKATTTTKRTTTTKAATTTKKTTSKTTTTAETTVTTAETESETTPESEAPEPEE